MMHFPANLKTFLFLLLWRLISVFIVQTAHVPDEYWQSLEVAHRLAFGYGFLTWEWTAKIRSYIYPFLISFLYRILANFSLDSVITLTLLPRLFQAMISAYADYRFYKWTKNKWMLYSLCINWYWYYCATRTLINSLETACTIIALSMFPWRNTNIKSARYLWVVGFLCTIRPTAAIVWVPLCIYHLSTSLQNKILIICQYGMVGFIYLLGSAILDSYCYKSLTVSWWEFFRLNVLQSISDMYGKEHTLWYIFSALPVLLGLHCVTFLGMLPQIIKRPKQFHREAVMLVVIGWTLGVYSLLSHKEFRFLLPLLPMFIYISTSCTIHVKVISRELLRKIFLYILTITNLIPGLYFSLIHQRGTLDIMNILQNDLTNENCTSVNILFLTPCHATPLYSHLHIDVPTRFLTCEPNFTNSNDYVDEADQFFENPMLWIRNNDLQKHGVIPSHLIMFDNIPSKIKDFLENYRLLSKVFHTHFPQSNYGKYIMLYKRID
ncbi:PREDICTED: GPI mannosyltransferase 3 [Polistes canadensis]|uniref:GPI mannosyltransferase 3 n=1 Tax=Polistes canadensis TaxID=91411 RepID=UPI000718B3E5|nr:PREDICTED: GPI mannosyltransferase 3 [Polistes canadensis]